VRMSPSVTRAATPMTDDVVPPGEPTVVSPGPLFPAEETNMIPCLCTISFANRMKRP